MNLSSHNLKKIQHLNGQQYFSLPISYKALTSFTIKTFKQYIVHNFVSHTLTQALSLPEK